MKKVGVIAAIIIINFILQTSFYSFISIFNVIPNISLILVVIFALMEGGIAGGVIGIFTGILYDTLVYDIFGVYTLIYFLVGALVGSYNEQVDTDISTAHCIFTFISTLFFHIAIYTILFFMKFSVENAVNILAYIGIEIILNTIIAFFLFKFIVYIYEKFNIRYYI